MAACKEEDQAKVYFKKATIVGGIFHGRHEIDEALPIFLFWLIKTMGVDIGAKASINADRRMTKGL